MTEKTNKKAASPIAALKRQRELLIVADGDVILKHFEQYKEDSRPLLRRLSGSLKNPQLPNLVLHELMSEDFDWLALQRSAAKLSITDLVRLRATSAAAGGPNLTGARKRFDITVKAFAAFVPGADSSPTVRGYVSSLTVAEKLTLLRKHSLHSGLKSGHDIWMADRSKTAVRHFKKVEEHLCKRPDQYKKLQARYGGPGAYAVPLGFSPQQTLTAIIVAAVKHPVTGEYVVDQQTVRQILRMTRTISEIAAKSGLRKPRALEIQQQHKLNKTRSRQAKTWRQRLEHSLSSTD